MKQLEEKVEALDTRTGKQGVALAGIQQDCENLKSQTAHSHLLGNSPSSSCRVSREI